MTKLSDFFGGGGWQRVSATGYVSNGAGITELVCTGPGVDSQYYAGTSINTLIPNVASSITAPAESDWVDLIDISAPGFIKGQFVTANVADRRDPWVFTVDILEATDSNLRVQAQDGEGNIFSDNYINNNGQTVNGYYTALWHTIVYGSYKYPLDFYKGLKLRACRSGTDFADSGTLLNVGGFIWVEMEEV